MAKVGVWLVGAQGSLASTVVLGARAIARKLAADGGLVTELPELTALPFVPLADLAFGGWDIVPTGLVARAREQPGMEGADLARTVSVAEPYEAAALVGPAATVAASSESPPTTSA